jgi:GNAT superfamily N-acetyltransferase
VRDDLLQSGGAIGQIGKETVGCLRFDAAPGFLHVRRVAVDPAWQRRGVGTGLMQWSHEYARTRGLPEVRVGVRVQLPENLRFYETLGYAMLAEHRHPGYRRVTWLELRRPV